LKTKIKKRERLDSVLVVPETEEFKHLDEVTLFHARKFMSVIEEG